MGGVGTIAAGRAAPSDVLISGFSHLLTMIIFYSNVSVDFLLFFSYFEQRTFKRQLGIETST